MRVLAFESSAKTASVALLTDGVLTAEAYQNCGLTHSVTLLSMAEDLLKQANVSTVEIDCYAVAYGPGSFTGVRIGVSAVKGLAWAAEKPCVGISTLEAMATQHCFQDAILCPVMDARRNQVYNALFGVKDGTLHRMTEDRAISIEELAQELKEIDGKIILIGDGALLCYNCLGETLPQLQLAPEAIRHQRAIGVAMAAYERAKRGEYIRAEELTPFYLRMSQAERERLARLEQEKN